MLGSPRSGSTWLLRLLDRSGGVVPINEPHIGVHLAPFAPNLLGLRAVNLPSEQWLFTTMLADIPEYFFSKRYEEKWRPQARRLIIDRLRSETRAKARMARIRRPVTVVKEPNGSQAAGMIVSLLPRSRLIFLLRDGRDVVSSEVDLAEKGKWLQQWGYEGRELPDRLAFVEHQAHTWRFRTEIVQGAYDALPPEQRILIRYEELRARPGEVLGELLRWLGIEVSAAQLEATIEAESFEKAPAEARGSGQFMRKASPGSWREGLTEEERSVMERVMGETLRRHGYPE